MSEYTILPLINAAFQPGEAKKMGLWTEIWKGVDLMSNIEAVGGTRS